VYVGTFNESGGPGEVVSLWLSNGTVAWRHATESIHYSSPAIVNGTLFIGVMGRYNTTSQITFDAPYGVLALSSSTGAERWFFPTGGPVAASPVVTDSRVFVPSEDGSVYALGRDNGTEMWRAAVDAGVSSPAFHGSTLYVGTGALGRVGQLIALDAATGNQRWDRNATGPVQASVAYADGKVFFSTNSARGTVHALNAANGAVVWMNTGLPYDYMLSSPVVSNGTLYVAGDNGHVVAFRSSRLAAVPRFTLAAPAELERGAVGDILIGLGPATGLMRNVTLTVTFTGLDLIGAMPPEDQRNGTSHTWRIVQMEYTQELNFTLRVQPPPSGAGVATVVARLAFVDNDGSPCDCPTLSRTISIVTPPAQDPSILIVVVAVLAGVAIFSAAVILVWRQRRGTK